MTLSEDLRDEAGEIAGDRSGALAKAPAAALLVDHLYGARVRKDLAPFNNQNFTEYTYFNGQPISEKDQNGNWTDYIYANGAKIARSPATESVLTISGTNIGSGDYNWFPVNGNGGLSNYTVGAGDTLVVRQRQHGVAVGNGAVQFNTDRAVSGVWQLGPDTDGQPAANDGTGDNIWHRRVFDMSPMAGNHMVGIYVGVPQSAAPGAWSVDYADMVLYSAASGTWIPLLTETHPVSLSLWSGSFNGGYTANLGWGVVPVATVPGASEHYYLDDHLGTTQMELSAGGWPMWQGNFAPFGQEVLPGVATDFVGPLPADGTAMHYKFTGKERDTESGLDYFGARYYSSSMGRFSSPDPSKLSVLPAFPQTWNRYSYVYNNPLALKDTNGKWPTSTHNQIIDNAFPNLSPAQRQILKNVSANQDGILNGGQGEASSYQHAMRAPGQSVADAQGQYNDFVKTNEDAANNLQIYMSDPDTEFTTLTPEALAAFGAALHAIEDSLSPAHAGFQVWDYNPLHILHHHNAESSISPQQMQAAVNAARGAFNNTFSFFGFTAGDNSNPTVTTTQGDGQPCGRSTGVPCGK